MFKSRRNRVWLDGGFVYKEFLVGDGRFEFDNLKHLFSSGVIVPKPISFDGNVLVTEYIEGVTLVDVIENKSIDADNLAEKIMVWFDKFYAAVSNGVCRGDVNCRNFILGTNGNLYGVDFEEMYTGRREVDLGKLTAFILTYEPPYTEYKTRLARVLTEQFVNQFGLDKDLVKRERELELAKMSSRRK